MKIVHVDSHRPWRGGEQQVLYLTRFLHAQGHHSVVVCQPQSALHQRCVAAGLPVQTLSMRHEADVLAAWRLGRYLRQQQIDILHMHTPHAHTLGLLASWLAPQVRKIVSRRVDFAPIRNRFSRWKYTRADLHYLAVSHAVRQVLIEDGIAPHQVQTVHSGIDLQRCAAATAVPPLFPAGTRVIGTVGHLAGHKGQRYLIASLPHLLRTHPQIGCVIAGTGDLQATLAAQAADLGVAAHVQFTGFRHDVLSLIQQFEVFVFPSVQEGLGTSILDAMALSKPVVATRAGGIPEVVQDGVSGLLVPPGNPAALAHAIAFLLQHPEQGRAFGAAGRQRVAQCFTAERMAARTLCVYQRLCHEAPLATHA
jgi:glycosyltransferase involved in cell wall biosynthesis